MVEFRGQLDRTLYRRALMTNARPAMFIGAILTVVGLWGIGDARADAPASWAVPLFVALLGLNLLLAPWRTTRFIFRTNKLIGQPFTGHLDQSGFAFDAPFGNSRLPWSAIQHAKVTPEFVLLYVSGQQFYMLTRRFFADDSAWERARELVRAHVKSK